jgi:hypothetical protein
MDWKNLIDKLSSYNLFNYLFPGFLFFVILKITLGLGDTSGLSLIEQIVIVYFSGLTLSRIGSLIIEGVFLKAYLKSKKIDTLDYFNKSNGNLKLEIIFEAMNMYRSLSAMSLVLMLIYLVYSIIQLAGSDTNAAPGFIYTLLALLLCVLFTFAFCKQRDKVIECLKSKTADSKKPGNEKLAEEIDEILKSLKKYLDK